MQSYGFECKACKSFFKVNEGNCPVCGEGNRLESVPDLYSVFDLKRPVTAKDLKNSFRQKVKSLHPDLNRTVSKEAFIELMAAYELLSNKKERDSYDFFLSLIDRGEASKGDNFSSGFNQRKKTMQKKSTAELQELASLFLKYDIYIKKIASQLKKFLRGKDWDNTESEKQSKKTALGFALVGVWFFVVGAIPVYYLTYYFLRRDSSRIDLFLSLLNIIQLLMLLTYFIIMESLPGVLHLFFWLDQLVMSSLFFSLKRGRG